MATKELRELRHKYKEAYTVYLSCVQALSEASHKGVWPSEKEVQSEAETFSELSLARQALLDALYAHTMKTKVGSNSK